MFSRFQKFMIALMFALVFAGTTLVVASAQDQTPPPHDKNSNCADCHKDTQMSWQNGPHGHAKDDPVFVKSWTDQGKPSACLTCHVTGYNEATGTWKEDGVTCVACHTDTGGEHPKTTMSVDATPNTCGTCHTDARFGLKDWEGSAHFQAGMDCSSCHDPHSASLKVTVNLRDPSPIKDASQLCISCHADASMNFPYSIHAKQGVTCIDCHLEHLENTNTDIHRMADHSFKASVQTCNNCHADQMHKNGEPIATKPTTNAAAAVVASPTPALELASVTPEPKPVSPLGYAGLASLIGLGGGMLLAPYLERWYRKFAKKPEEVHHDDQ